MKIALIEPAFHFEVVIAYIKMFAPHVDSIEVWTTNEVRQVFIDFSPPPNVSIFTNDGMLFEDFIKEKIIPTLKDHDIIIVTTNEALDKSSISLNQFEKAYLVVHNLNFTLRPFSLKHILVYPKRLPVILLKYLKFLTISRNWNRKEDFRNYNRILLPNQNIVNFALENYKEFESKLVLSGDFYGIETLDHYKYSDAEIKIIVPGTLEAKSRNYYWIEELLKIRELNTKIIITLLGKLKEAKIVNKLIALNHDEQIQIVFKKEGFSLSEYDEILRNADFAILPLRKYMYQGNTYEIVGKTCVSGSFNDVVRFGIPFLIPEDIKIPEFLEKVSEKFKTKSDFRKLVLSWVNNRTFLDHRSRYGLFSKTQGYSVKGAELLNNLIR